MKMHKIIKLLVLLSIYGDTNLFAQLQVDEILKRTVSKGQIINRNFRVLEKSFSDNITDSDSILPNCTYSHRFSALNTYNINVYASSEDAYDINVEIYKLDANNTLQFVRGDNITSDDVSFTFKPTTTGRYYLGVWAKLKEKVTNCFFNLLIDRE